MTRLSATLTRRSSAAGSGCGARAAGCRPDVAPAVVVSCSPNCSIFSFSLLAGLALGVVDRAELRVGGRAVGRHRVELPGRDRGFFGRGRAERAQVVGGLEPADPRELVGLVQTLA